MNQHLEPLPAPAGVPDATEASRIERLLLLLLEHLGVTPEAVQEAWRGNNSESSTFSQNMESISLLPPARSPQPSGAAQPSRSR